MYDGQVIATSITFLTTHVYFDTNNMYIVCKYDVLLKVYKKKVLMKRGCFKFEKLYYFMNARYVMKCHEKL